MIDRQQGKRLVFAASTGAAAILILAAGPRLYAAAGTDAITACVGANGDIRVTTGGGACKPHETPITWNNQGAAGSQGSPGPAGPAGPAGPEGPPGRDGRDGHGDAPPLPTINAQMRVDGLNGNNPTPIISFSLGATSSTSVSGGGGGAGKVTFANLVVSKMLDGDSVPLLQMAATGQIIRNLVIELFDAATNLRFATYTFEDVVVTSNVIGSSASTVNEQDAFDFRRITSDVTLNGQTFHSCFDIKALSPCS